VAKLDLPDVTLVVVSDVAIAQSLEALERCMKGINFATVQILSSREPPSLPRGITWGKTAPISSKQDYSRFMLHKLSEWIDTSHVLCVQWDGYVLNADAWDPAFLDFDYIGSPWPHFSDGFDVGNGGFSLRSKRLLGACRSLPADPGEAEDVAICRTHRAQLEEEGLRFAPVELARKFGYERSAPRGDEFGFHGVFNLIALLPRREAIPLLRSIDRRLIARSEIHEMLVWAIRKCEVRMSLALMQRLFRGA
jgi:hypothetical protein